MRLSRWISDGQDLNRSTIVRLVDRAEETEMTPSQIDGVEGPLNASQRATLSIRSTIM